MGYTKVTAAGEMARRGVTLALDNDSAGLGDLLREMSLQEARYAFAAAVSLFAATIEVRAVTTGSTPHEVWQRMAAAAALKGL